ncbi:synaptotagmin-like protein 2 [Pelodytes ibericus]
MIDLSFLTEAEQEAILKVLHRDAELKKAEEQRVRNLQDVVNDQNELKYKSGQWFYEAKSKRHRDKIHGADLVRASIRKRKKPATIAELSKSNKDKAQRRWVNHVNKDLFIPPELYGVMEDPVEMLEDVKQSKVESNQSARKVSFLPSINEDALKNGSASPAKQRKNPFNSEDAGIIETDSGIEKPKLENGMGPKQELPKTEKLSSKVKFGVKLPYPELKEDSPISLKATEGSLKYFGQAPVPKPRKLLKNIPPVDRPSPQVQREDSVTSTGRPKGILKRCSSSSSTDSENIRLSHSVDPNRIGLPVSPIPEMEKENALTVIDGSPESSVDRLKQVRFSTNVLQKPPSHITEPYIGRETDEFRILDPGSSKTECDPSVINRYVSSKKAMPSQLDIGTSVDESACKNALDDPDHSVSTLTPSTASLVSDVEDTLYDSAYSSEGKENMTFPKTNPEINLVLQENTSTDAEPVYAKVQKGPKTAQSDKIQDYDMEESQMEPRFIGQGGKIQNIGRVGKPLEFGKSYGGSGKTSYATSNLSPTSNKEPADLENDSLPGGDTWEFPHPVPGWKKPYILERGKTSSSPVTIEPKISERWQPEIHEFPSNITFEENKPAISPINFISPVATNVDRPDLSGNKRGTIMVPQSTNFKVMSLKERIYDPSWEEKPNPAQFQSLKHFWDVEGRSPPPAPKTEGSTNQTLDNVLNRSKPRKDLEHRHSKDVTDPLVLSNSFDSLSEEEQTSHKVASWLAQTPALYENEPTYTGESRTEASKEIEKEVQRSTAKQKLRNKETLREEALQAPHFPKTEDPPTTEALRLAKEDPQNRDFTVYKIRTSSPLIQGSMGMQASTTDIGPNDRLFYDRIVRATSSMNSSASPIYNTVYQSESSRRKDQAPAEIVEKTVAPERNANEDFKIGCEKLLAEHESHSLNDQYEEDFSFSKNNPTDADESEEALEETSARPAQSSFKIDYESLADSSPFTEENVQEPEEVIEKTTLPKNDNPEFIAALQKLELEASEPLYIPETIYGIEQKVNFEKPRTDSIGHVGSSGYNVGTRNIEIEATEELKPPRDKSYGKMSKDQAEQEFHGDVVQESINRATVETQENSAAFHDRLMQLEEEASLLPQDLDEPLTARNEERPHADSKEPADQETDHIIAISQSPNKEIFVSKTRYSNAEFTVPADGEKLRDEDTNQNKETSSDGLSSRGRRSDSQDIVKETSPLDVYLASCNKNRPKSLVHSSDLPGNYRKSVGILYKKPETESPGVSKPNSIISKPGKQEQVAILHDPDPSKPDKYTIEVMKAKDESISKVLDWFSRSSESNDEVPTVCLLGRESEINEEPRNLHASVTKEGSVKNIENSVKVAIMPENIQTRSDVDQPRIIKEPQPTNNPSSINAQADSLTDESQPSVSRENMPMENHNPPSLQISNQAIGEPLVFGKSNGGVGKMQDVAYQPERGIELEGIKDGDHFEADSEDLEAAKDPLRLSRDAPVFLDKENGEEVAIAWRKPSILERSESFDQDFSRESRNPSTVQKRVNNLKLVLERAPKPKSVLIEPGQLLVGSREIQRVSSVDNDEGESLVTFKKVMLDEEEHSPKMSQLKSFWEKNQADVVKSDRAGKIFLEAKGGQPIKQASSTQSLIREDGHSDKLPTTIEPSARVRKRHTFHYLFEKDQATEPELKAPVRSISVSERTDKTADMAYTSSTFQSARSFWSVGNNLKGTIVTPPYERASSPTDGQPVISKPAERNRPDDVQKPSLLESAQQFQTHTEVGVPDQLGRTEKDGEKPNTDAIVQSVPETICKTAVEPKKDADFRARLQKLKMEMLEQSPVSVQHKLEPVSSVPVSQDCLLSENITCGHHDLPKETEQEKNLPAGKIKIPKESDASQNLGHMHDFGMREPKEVESITLLPQEATCGAKNDDQHALKDQSPLIKSKEEIQEVIENTVIPKPPSNSFSSRLQSLYDEYSKSRTRSELLTGADDLPSHQFLSEVYQANESVASVNSSDGTIQGGGRVSSISFTQPMAPQAPSSKIQEANFQNLPKKSDPDRKVVSEIIIKSRVQQKSELSEFNIKLNKLKKEFLGQQTTTSADLEFGASGGLPLERRTSDDDLQPNQGGCQGKENGEKLHHPEVYEVVEKSSVIRKSCAFDAGIAKLANEIASSKAMDLESTSSGSLVCEPESPGVVQEKPSAEKLQPQEVEQMVEKSQVCRNSDAFNTGLAKLTKESRLVDPPQTTYYEDNLKEKPSNIANNSPTESGTEIIDDKIQKTICLPKARFSDFDSCLQKLYKESLGEMPNLDDKVDYLKVNQNKPLLEGTSVAIQRSPSVNSELQNEGTTPTLSEGSLTFRTSVEVSKAYVPNKTKLIEFKEGQKNTVSRQRVNLSPVDLKNSSSGSKSDLRHNLNVSVQTNVSPSLPELVSQGEISQGSVTIQGRHSRKEIVEVIEKPIILPRTRFNFFESGLLRLYKETMDPTTDETSKLVQENAHQEVESVNKEGITLPTDLKGPFNEDANVGSSHTISVKKEIRPDERFASGTQYPDIEQHIEKSTAPTKESCVENLQTEAKEDEEGSGMGNLVLSSPHKALRQSMSLEHTVSEIPSVEDKLLRIKSLERIRLKSELVGKASSPAGQKCADDDSLEYAPVTPTNSETPISQSSSSLRRSTLELYLETPYRREMSKSIDFTLTGYVTPDAGENRCADDPNLILNVLKRSEAKMLPKAVEEVVPARPSENKAFNPHHGHSLHGPGVELRRGIPPHSIMESKEITLFSFDPALEGTQGVGHYRKGQPISASLRSLLTYDSLPDIPKEDVLLQTLEVPIENTMEESQFSNPEKLKRLSQSVPAFLHDETDGRETDSASESSFQIGKHKKSPSSLTNLSGSSGMASLSSVSGSVMSVYSGDFGNVDIKGNIQFAVDYVEQLKEFHVFVAQCKDLAAADVKKLRSDPYVKSYLLPDKAKMGKRKTAVKKKTLNPAYNEILRYKIEKSSLLNQRLNLSVWHNDALGRNSFLGEVDLDLATWDWTNKQMNWYPLQPRTPAAGIGLENRGEMKLSLKYIPEATPGVKASGTGEVHIWIKDCSQLPILRGNKINSFVKCTILPDTSRKSRQKTRTVDKTPNPVFNHTMVYDGFKGEDLREACVELSVWDHNKLTNHFLGGLRIGLGTGKSYGTVVDWMDSSMEESVMWEKMMSSPNTWIEAVLPLRMLKMAKLAK